MISPEKLGELLSQRDETPRCEFKLKYVLSGQSRSKMLDEIAKDVIALANTAGRRADDYAYLVIGAGDKLKADESRDCEDVRHQGYDRRVFADIVNARCTPQLADLRYEQIILDGNCYGVIVIPPSPHIHTLTRDLNALKGMWRKGSVLTRHGDEVAVATFDELRLMEREKKSITEVSEASHTIPDLLLKAQSESVPLSQCVTEALSVARKSGRGSLERFCIGELRGWRNKDLDKDSAYRPTHRVIEVYVSKSPVDINNVGFQSTSDIFNYLHHSDRFIATEMLMSEPISQIEANAPADPNKGFGTLVTTLGKVNPKAKKPSSTVYLYFSGHTFRNVLHAVRTELTRQLIDLLPETGTA